MKHYIDLILVRLGDLVIPIRSRVMRSMRAHVALHARCETIDDRMQIRSVCLLKRLEHAYLAGGPCRTG